MAIDYKEVGSKVNELNRSAIKIVDIASTLEKGTLFGEPLNLGQISGITNSLKSEADNLKTIAGEIKNLTGL